MSTAGEPERLAWTLTESSKKRAKHTMPDHNFEEFLRNSGMSPDEQQKAQIEPFANAVAVFHHGLLERGVDYPATVEYTRAFLVNSLGNGTKK